MITWGFFRPGSDFMSKYRMFFFKNRFGHSVESCPTIGVHGIDQDAAIAMSQRIWDGLAAEEPALGFSLLDTQTRRICYVELRQSLPERPRPTR
jgi:hypothetical protein